MKSRSFLKHGLPVKILFTLLHGRKNMKVNSFKVSIILLQGLINIAYPNGAAFNYSPEGGGVIPFEIKGITLVNELINIYKDSSICLFNLESLRPDSIMFHMGFPFECPGNKSDIENCKSILESINFEVKVNDKIIPCELMSDSLKSKEYPLLFLWNVSMKSKERTKIQCKYKTLWSHLEADGIKEEHSLTYLRSPARYWDGNIIEAVFNIHYSGIMENVPSDKIVTYNISPLDYYFNFKDKIIQWREFNVKNMPDIHFNITKPYFKKTIEDIYQMIGIALNDNVPDSLLKVKFNSDEDVKNIFDYFGCIYNDVDCNLEGVPEWYYRILNRVLRNYYYAINGWEMNDKLLKICFSNINKRTSKIKYTNFSEIYKNNISYLLKYENKNYYNRK
jgi:hypothetical protein